MKKTFEQIVLEAQAARSTSMEELFLLWQLMQQMEEEPAGETGYADIDQRSFHIDGILSPEHFDGTLYLLKETNMRKFIQKGQTGPVITDIRRDFLHQSSPSGQVEYMDYLSGMQQILNRDDGQTPDEQLLRMAVVYLNKRGGKGAADSISLRYGQYYISFLKRQLELIRPKTIVCCSEEMFRLVVMEVFQNKKQIKNHGEYMRWKDVVVNDVFLADKNFRHVKDPKKAKVRVINMWNPAYRVNNGQYVSLEEYLKEFERRVSNSEMNS